MVRFRADGEFLRAELPEGLGRTQALLVLQTEETVSSLLNEDALWPMLRTPSPPRWPRPSPESRCAKSLLRRACRNGMASTIWTRRRSERWQAALRSGALALPSSPCAALPYPVTFACFT